MPTKRKSLLAVDYITKNESPLLPKKGKMDPAGVLRDSVYREEADQMWKVANKLREQRDADHKDQDADMTADMINEEAESEEFHNMGRLGPRSKKHLKSLLRP